MVDTPRTQSYLLANVFQDGQPAGSITASDMRDFVVSTGNLLTAATSTPLITRTLADRAQDAVNLKDYGAVMDGTVNDGAAWQAAYNATGDNCTLNIPTGKLLHFGYTQSAGKSIHYKSLGALDFGTGAAGSNPVFAMGDGDLFSGYFGGRYNFTRTLVNSSNGYANVAISLDNGSTTASPGVASALVVTGTTRPTTILDLFTFVLNTQLTSRSNGGGRNQEVATSSTVGKYGAATTWQYFGQTIDYSGFQQGSIVVAEYNIGCNGPEPATTAYNPGVGGRTGIEFANNSYQPANWTATTAHAVGDVVTGTTAPGNTFTYVCTVAGTSGSTQPTWPTSTGTVTDGTVTWRFGTTIASEVSRLINMGSSGNVSYGTGLWCSGQFYNACIDTCWATLVSAHSSVPAAIRIGKNQKIDFSGDSAVASTAAQNLHTLRYDSGNALLAYAVSGTDMLRVFDTGRVVTISETLPNTGPAPFTLNTSASSTGAVMTFTATTGVAVGMYLWFPGSIARADYKVLAVTSTTVTLNQSLSVTNGQTIGFVNASFMASTDINTGNGTTLSQTTFRSSSNSGWTGATTRLQLSIDTSAQSFIDFSPPAVTGGLGLGYGSPGSSTYAMYVLTNGNVQFASGVLSGVRVFTGATAITHLATDQVIVVNKTSGAATAVNLMSSPATGQTVSIKDGKGDAATNNITITPAAGLIDGSATLVLNINYASVDLVYNGTKWNIL